MKRSLLALGALVLLVVVWLVAGRNIERQASRAAPAPVFAPPPVETVPARSVAPAAPIGRAAVEIAQSLAATPAVDPVAAQVQPAPPSVHIRGRALDRRGEGVPALTIVRKGRSLVSASQAEAGTKIATSGADGSFEANLAGLDQDVYLEAGRDSGFATLRAAHVSAKNAAHEQLVLVAPAIPLGGTVVEAGGAPLAGAHVRFEVPFEALVGFPEVADRTVEADQAVASGPDGRFAFAHVPATSGARLVVRHAGHRSLESAAPSEPRDDLWLELERVTEEEPWLLGVVVRADGTPARGAKVRLDTLSDTTDVDGRFGLEKDWASPTAPLVAALVGFQPAVLPMAGELLQQEHPPALLRLVLGGPTLSIRGRILDARGEPCSGWQVALQDGTLVTPNRVPFDLAEDLAAGKEIATESNKRGEFVLPGLLARDYVVQAYQRGTLLMLRSAPVAAGTRDLVLRVPPDATFERLAGVVVARDGTPLAGVEVGSSLVTQRSGGATSSLGGGAALTDASGGFVLADVPRQHVTLSVSGEGVIPEGFELDAARAGQTLRLSVARRCHFRVALEAAPASEGAARPDAISAFDSEDVLLPLYLFEGNGWSSTERLDLTELRTNTLGVSEDARTLAFYRENAELRRIPLALVPGEVIVVRGDE